MVAQDPPSPAPFPLALSGLILLSFFWAMACNLVLDAMHVWDEPAQLVSHTLSARGLGPFILGSVLLWLLLLLIICVLGRFWIGAGLLLALVVGFGSANRLKLEQRQEPVYPSDLVFAAQWRFLVDMVGWWRLVLVLVTLAGIVWLVHRVGRRLTSRRYPPLDQVAGSRAWAGLVAGRALTILLTLVILAHAASFNSTGNAVRAAYDGMGARWAWWYQKLNYERNGVVGGFLYNTRVPAMAVPSGYSKQRLHAIADRYTAVAAETNRSRSGSFAGVNVVLILSEAFTDPLKVPGVTFAEDPIPFTRKLMDATVSGPMLTQMIGGGTANMEFESLTGMSLALFNPQMNSPFHMLLPDHPRFPSFVRYLETQGHRGVALHPYLTTMYKRELAYPALGVSDFVSEDDMRHTDRLEGGEFVSDEATFTEVLHHLESVDEALLLNVVTMQNHFPTDGVYADPIRVEGLPDNRRDLAGGYARGLRYTDEALEKLLTDLETLEEPTVVVFFGDHHPGFWPDDLIEQHEVILRQTPFLLWTNFRDLPTRTHPPTSPTHFLPLVFEHLDAPIPPYVALLDAVRQEIPAMEQELLFDANGDIVTPADLSPRARRLLQDYRLVQYDLSIGERFSLEQMLPQ